MLVFLTNLYISFDLSKKNAKLHPIQIFYLINEDNLNSTFFSS